MRFLPIPISQFDGPPVKARQTLVAILVAIACVSAIDAYFQAHHMRQPGWWHLTSTLVLSALIFGWYYFDSNDRSYRRSKLLNIAVVALALVAIPYYLVRSREKGQKLKAIFKLMGFCALAIVSVALGQFLGGIIG